MFLSKIFKHTRARVLTALAGLAMVFGAVTVVSTVATTQQNEVMETKADYSSTIRVYADLTWTNIDYVRLGTDQVAGNAALSSSDAKYNQSLGKYVRDISSSSTYDKMGFFFSQSSTWWFYQYDNGYVYRDGGFRPGYEYQLKDVSYAGDSGNNKKFSCNVYEIGKITDNVINPTLYFVNGYSWGTVDVYFWGGTASTSYPGQAMSASEMKLRCYVGDTEYLIGVYKFTVSGSCAYVQFNMGSSEQKTGDLRPVDGGVYWYGVDAAEYTPITTFMLTLMGDMGTWKGESGSICAMDQTQASSLVATYESLKTGGSDRQKSSISNSTIYTYDPDNTSSKKDIALSVIYTELKYMADNGRWSAHIIPGGRQDNQSPITTTLWIVLGAGVAGLAAIGTAYFVSKKKKRHQA